MASLNGFFRADGRKCAAEAFLRDARVGRSVALRFDGAKPPAIWQDGLLVAPAADDDAALPTANWYVWTPDDETSLVALDGSDKESAQSRHWLPDDWPLPPKLKGAIERYDGTILIEPKPQEPTKHQYDYDVATVYGFLKEFGLEKDQAHQGAAVCCQCRCRSCCCCCRLAFYIQCCIY